MVTDLATDRIEREIVIAAPVERVWAVVTEPDYIAKWFGTTAEVELHPGGAAVFGWPDFGRFNAVVERVEPQRLFSYRWCHAADTAPTEGNTTLVEFTLAPEGAGTRLRVVETGFAALDLPVDQQRARFEDNVGGWKQELGDLVELVEQLKG